VLLTGNYYLYVLLTVLQGEECADTVSNGVVTVCVLYICLAVLHSFLMCKVSLQLAGIRCATTCW